MDALWEGVGVKQSPEEFGTFLLICFLLSILSLLRCLLSGSKLLRTDPQMAVLGQQHSVCGWETWRGAACRGPAGELGQGVTQGVDSR